MSALMQILDQALGGDTVEQIGSQLGMDPATAQSAVSLAIPVLVQALSRNAASPDGAQALESAVARDHDGSILDQLGGLLGGGLLGGGGGQSGLGSMGSAILGHILGGSQGNVEQGIGRATGLDPGSAGQLLAILAPLVMGALGRARQQGGGGLEAILGGAQQQVQQQAPESRGLLATILDSNQDGSALDDVARMGAGLLGGLFGGRK
jgi:hypothetical protein